MQPWSHAFAEFLEEWPDYSATETLDRLREDDYSRLDAGDHVYLDYTGAGLYGASQVRLHLRMLEREVLGNPHSSSLTSSAATRLVEDARRRVLRWFNAPESEYTAIFTANATGAIKKVGEAYPFRPGSTLLLTFDNHNSVNGVRQFAWSHGATVCYTPLTTPDLRVDEPSLVEHLDRPSDSGPRLFAYPAQSNFSGVQHSLDFVTLAHDRGWDVLLDAAAYVPTNHLDVGAVGADFVSVSFYKMFGYPTGVGCLLAKRKTLERLRRPWFAGGTVNFATVHGLAHILARGEAGYEDGTVNFLGIPAVPIGLDVLERAGLNVVRARLGMLTAWMLRTLLEMRHANGRHMVRIYGPANTAQRGATLTFNLYDPEGHLLDYRRIEELASARRISLRTGCFCNPGAGETAEAITDDDVAAALAGSADMSLPRFMQIIQHRGGRSAGAIRASLGIVSNFVDAWKCVEFVSSFRDQTRLTIGDVTFDVESCRVIRDGA